jgi:hypothetical protein
MNKFKKLSVPLLLILSTIVLFTVTDPSRIPLPLLVVPFILIFAVMFTVFNLIIGTLINDLRFSKRRIYIASGILATIPTLLVVFQSLHQLTVKDVVIMFAFVIACAFYISKIDFN